MITKDMDLLDRLPAEQTERRAELQRTIDERIDDLIASTERARELREIAASYKGNWRDIVVFICAILFTIIWWNVSHSRANWMLMFIVMIVLSVVAGIYAGRGVARAIKRLMRRERRRQTDSVVVGVRRGGHVRRFVVPNSEASMP